MNPVSTEALLELIQQHHPAGLENDDPRYADSREGRRLSERVAAHKGGTPAWKDFVQELPTAFPQCAVWDATVPWHDPCYTCRVSLPGFVVGSPRYEAVVLLLSHLAPVYALYASRLEEKGPGLPREHWTGFPPLPAKFQAHEGKLARLVESTFGATRLSNEVLFTRVPDRVPRTGHCRMGEATILDCLFTPYRM